MNDQFKVTSRPSPAPTYTRTECDECFEECTASNDSRDANTAWARRHVAKTSHTVYVVTEATRIYEVAL